MDTFDNMALSALRTFLNDTQYENIVYNMQMSSRTENKGTRHRSAITDSNHLVAKADRQEDNAESECAVCKHVLPPLFRFCRI
jgi:hypothetical protein